MKSAKVVERFISVHDIRDKIDGYRQSCNEMKSFCVIFSTIRVFAVNVIKLQDKAEKTLIALSFATA